MVENNRYSDIYNNPENNLAGNIGNILESKEITKSYITGQKAVDAVSLELKQGKVYAFLGPNGSGKTTWMKLAAGLIHPTSGQMLYRGQPIGPSSKAEIAYASTEPYFYNWMTIKDAGKYYQDFFQDFSIDRYRKMLDRMELSENLKLKKLSTGMMAKMKIAVTMARKAHVYLLDEPLNGIDLLARDAITRTIFETIDSNVTMMISSHMVEELERLADYAIFMKQGKLVQITDVKALEAQGGNVADLYRSIYSERREEDAEFNQIRNS